MIWRSEANTNTKNMLEIENSCRILHCVREKISKFGICLYINFKTQEIYIQF